MLELLWLIPVLPFVGAALNGVLGPRVSPRLTTAVGVGASGLAALVALGVLGSYVGGGHGEVFEQVLYTWAASEVRLDMAFQLDALSAVMVFVVTFVGFWIHLYSAGYMAGHRGYQRYFVYLNLFLGA
ncbi:MAG: NADH-quinone oxidoreductase subunit L, partial [Thermoanaerobaculia bacterium]